MKKVLLSAIVVVVFCLSVQINQSAMPTRKQEQKQRANGDVITGAMQTGDAVNQSLAGALT